LEIVKALGRLYDFEFIFYWQPTIPDKLHFARHESNRRTEIAATEPHVSQVFSETRTPVFVDFFHLSETGNEMVVIVADALERLAGRRG
jgi:hypothetical protein